MNETGIPKGVCTGVPTRARKALAGNLTSCSALRRLEFQ